MPSASPYGPRNDAMKTAVSAAVLKLFPLVAGNAELRATRVWVDDKGFDPEARNAHQKAREMGGTLGGKVYGELELWRDGKRVDGATVPMGDLPLFTTLGTAMVKGADWYVPFAQLRLKPGAYTRQMANGHYETFIPLKGGSLSVWMDPERGVVKLGQGSVNVSWFAVMQALGAKDAEIAKALGDPKLVTMNQVTPEAAKRDIDKLYTAVTKSAVDKDLVRGGIVDADPEHTSKSQGDKVAAIRAWMDSKSVDPFVTRKTMGAPISVVNNDLLLRAAKKVVDIYRGDEEADDRDAPEFKQAIGPETLMAERIAKWWRMFKTKTLRRLETPDAKVKDLVGPAWLNTATVGYYGGGNGMSGGMASTAEAANPLAILSEHSKMTLTGEGGIQSSHAITNEARLFRPTASNTIDLVHTPEGQEIGVTTHAAVNTTIDGTSLASVYFPVKNGKVDTKHYKRLTIEQASDEVVMYPEFFDPKTGKITSNSVRAIINGDIERVSVDRVTYAIPSGRAMFDHTSNAALFFAHTHPNRGMMAGKHLTQALPLVHRERPLAQLVDGQGNDMHEKLAQSFVVRSRVAGIVTKVTPKMIEVGSTVHELFDKYPMQAKVAIHHVPVVKVGDHVKVGDLLADSNYSRDGALTLGVNLRSAYMPWKNAANFEDAIVISESAAKLLASHHIHRLELPLDSGAEVNRKLFIAQFPTAFVNNDNLAKLDDDGYVKTGSTIKPGDVLVAAVRKRTIDAMDKSAKNLSSIHKMLERPYADASVVWDEQFIGTVVRVVKRRDKVEVHVETEEPCVVADKLSMSSAAKGTIAAVVPDAEMPHDQKGRPIQVIFNPHGVAGRINPSQTIEQAVGKLVRDGGETYSHANFDNVDHADIVAKRLKKAGLTHAEILHDPVTGKDLEEPVATGYNYVLKLDHAVRKKFSARGRDGYTMDESPTRGKGKGGQSFDHLTTYALLGHNAHAILGEAYGVRGAKNDDYWLAYQAGEVPPPPKVPFAFEKMRAYMHGMGIDTQIHDGNMKVLPMTDARVREQSNGEITRAHMIKAKNLATEEGGLFDEKITGGLTGDHYGHIELGRTMPHPLFERPIRDITGLKTGELYGLIGGTRHLDTKTGKVVEAATTTTLTGEAAFKHLLTFDPKAKLAETKRKLANAVGSDRNKLHRVTRYLRGLETTGLSPVEAYMTSTVPVIPPKYRPIIEMSGGGLRVADANILYRDLLLTKNMLGQAEKDGTLGPQDLAKARLALYDAHAAAVGLAPAMTKPHGKGDEIKGFAEIIKGENNKEGFFQRSMTRRRMDYTGRSTIEPDASLGPDEIGIPIEMAWKIYEPAIVRRLAQQGWKPADAMLEVKNRTASAKGALDAEIESRPVLYNRAPSLHKWSVLAGRARLVPGKEIKTSPFTTGPLGSDYDGDTISVIVPLSEAARKESFKMLPTNNLFYDKDRSLVSGVDKDVITGLFMLTRPGVPVAKTYKTAADALSAYRDPKAGLKMNSLVTVAGRQQQIGWLILEELLPERYVAPLRGSAIDGKKLDALLTSIAKNDPGQYNMLSRKIAQAGFSASAAAGGITATIDELAFDRTKINRLLDQLEKDIDGAKTPDAKRSMALKQFEDVVKPALRTEIADHLNKINLGGAIFLAAKPSSKLGFDSYQQMMASPVLVKDVQDRVIPQVIRSGYGQGIAASDYVMTTPGARAGVVARSRATALPGYLAKVVAANMAPVRITVADCGTTDGITLPLSNMALKNYDADLLDRHLATSVLRYKHNDIVTPAMLSELRAAKVANITVRSAMTCKAAAPPCSMCAGRTPDGKLHEIGANIGMNYGQSVSERSTQLILRAFHSGGAVGAGDSLNQGFARLNELLTTPDIIKNQGTLSDVAGSVSSVRPAPQGGYYIMVAGKEHYVGTGRTPKVKAGDHVEVGDPLSDGNYRPQELALKKGNLVAQQYVVNQAREAYQHAGAVVRMPVLEVVASATMRWMEITDDGGEKDLAPGDMIHENDFNARHAKNPKIKAVPTVPGLNALPIRRSNDLFERLNFQRLTDALTDVPAMGGVSDLRGGKAPSAGLAYGALFRPVHEGDSAFNAHRDAHHA